MTKFLKILRQIFCQLHLKYVVNNKVAVQKAVPGDRAFCTTFTYISVIKRLRKKAPLTDRAFCTTFTYLSVKKRLRKKAALTDRAFLCNFHMSFFIKRLCKKAPLTDRAFLRSENVLKHANVDFVKRPHLTKILLI